MKVIVDKGETLSKVDNLFLSFDKDFNMKLDINDGVYGKDDKSLLVEVKKDEKPVLYVVKSNPNKLKVIVEYREFQRGDMRCLREVDVVNREMEFIIEKQAIVLELLADRFSDTWAEVIFDGQRFQAEGFRLTIFEGKNLAL